MINEIIDAVDAALRKEFGEGYEVYQEEGGQNQIKPGFFISCQNLAVRQVFGNNKSIQREGRENMENAFTIKTLFITIVGGAGGMIAVLCGGWSEDLNTLMILMGIDFIMGLLIAAIWKKSGKSNNGALSSNSAWKGIVQKGVSLLVVVVAHRLDVLIGTDYIKTAVIIAFCADELISIIENLGIMGIPMPSAIVKSIDILKDKAEKGGCSE